MSEARGASATLPHCTSAVKLWVTRHETDHEEQVHVFWEQKYFLQLLKGDNEPVNLGAHRKQEKKLRTIERLLEQFGLPDEVCGSRT